ncbi:hypothetical protein PENANT_c008G10673 [Penicillium antarcticum]|uniref:BTB domain-containing protein n=1 Tax=Penicillium antarcticum TaxID=416450 RepID=A0A1V6QAT2_9EURO|nr:uncharacterized protein N7508_007040 [Penicillium antarcticum]KAJ5302177.1 hypothetical protein N7508_007040 [Penicillium antarcticum]OQD86341.1 hypothetical protein PENANT_c008G10673 [Penicillium antarcticum]
MSSDSEKPAKSIFTKKPIQIEVGRDNKIYYVHHGALEACPSFDIEFEYMLDWSAFDEQTVECVLSFLYTGDYPVNLPSPESTKGKKKTTEDAEEELVEEPEDEDTAEVEEEPEEAVEVEEEEEDPEEEPQSPASEPASPDIETTYERRCQSEPTSAPSISGSQSESGDDLIARPLTPLRDCPGVRLPDEFTPPNRQDEPQEADVAEIYLHAKVYSFACHYDFIKLKEFTLNRLAQILDRLQRTQLDLFPYLADAIRLIYTTTEEGDSARYLLAQFVALKYTTLLGEAMNKLVAEGGDFMVDVSGKLARKISSMALEEKVEELTTKNSELEIEAAADRNVLKSLKEEVEGWESWNRQLAYAQRRKQGEKYPIFTYEI